jgi:curved DNA-binding protein CbpA
MDYSAACQWLGIDDPTIELDESILKSVFRRTAVHEHPDKSHHEDATQRFQMVKRAHDFLIQCVGRGETGPNAPSYTDEDGDGDDDDDEYYYEDDEDDDDNDFVDLFMAHIFATGGGGVHFSHGPRGGPTVHVPFPGAFFGAGFGRPSSSFPSAGMHDRGGYDVYDNVDDVVDDDDDDNYHRYYERKQQQAKRKTEAAKHKAEAEELQKAEAIQRAMEEGRDCFEMWTVKALNQEATRRGFNIRGLQKESILHLLIEDERQKRKKRQLKEVAPLLDEWVEIIIVNGGDYDASRNKNLNGLKARAVNYEKGPFISLFHRSHCYLLHACLLASYNHGPS